MGGVCINDVEHAIVKILKSIRILCLQNCQQFIYQLVGKGLILRLKLYHQCKRTFTILVQNFKHDRCTSMHNKVAVVTVSLFHHIMHSTLQETIFCTKKNIQTKQAERYLLVSISITNYISNCYRDDSGCKIVIRTHDSCTPSSKYCLYDPSTLFDHCNEASRVKRAEKFEPISIEQL